VDCCALFSGGKDSCYAVNKALEAGHEVKCLLTMLSVNPHSYMFHTPNARLARVQSEASDIPLVEAKTKGEKEKELVDLEKAISKLEVDAVLCGAIASEYQKKRVQGICDRLGLKLISPIWHSDPGLYMEDLIRDFEVYITAVAAYGLTEQHLGRRIDKQFLDEIRVLSKKYGVHMAFEGGEAETFVTNAPFFKKRIAIEGKKVWNKDSGIFEITRAKLI